jgi:ribosomal subunit interface protein
MNLDLVFKDVKPTEEIVKRLETKLSKIEKILHRAPPVRFTFSKAKGAYTCAARFVHRGHEFVAQGSGEDVFSASDDAVHKLELQVTKDRKRIVSRRQGGARLAIAGA